MKNAIQVFSFEHHRVRTMVDEKGNPLFVAKDVAVALGYARPNDAIKQHCKGAVNYRTLSTKGGNQEMRVIYEPDVYRLIFGSKLKSAIKFQNWVFEDVLPSIRKNGHYFISLQAEYNRLCMEEAVSKMKGSFHGLGLYQRKLEKATLHTKIAECEAILQLEFAEVETLTHA